jgi:spore coat protein A
LVITTGGSMTSTESPVLGTTEIWRSRQRVRRHASHAHAPGRFHVLDRQRSWLQNGEIVTTGPPVPPDPSEAGWKDTAPVGPTRCAV